MVLGVVADALNGAEAPQKALLLRRFSCFLESNERT